MFLPFSHSLESCRFTESIWSRFDTTLSDVHFKAAMTAHSTPRNTARAEAKWPLLATLSTVPGVGQSDLAGGSGSVISGIGTSNSGFFVS